MTMYIAASRSRVALALTVLGAVLPAAVAAQQAPDPRVGLRAGWNDAGEAA